MLRRIAAIVVLAWVLGFIWFAIALPQPLAGGKSAAVAVPTGGKGRIDRGISAVEQGLAQQMLVSGVGREVKPHEFALEHKVPPALMACCVTLGFDSVDTRSNATEIAQWLKTNGHKSVRLVTSDWHMRRAAYDLRMAVADGTVVTEDAVATRPTFAMLFLEYNKYVARRIAGLVGL
jgi:uncharacterized SAM-binding protein YcdF (DUF218 family)